MHKHILINGYINIRRVINNNKGFNNRNQCQIDHPTMIILYHSAILWFKIEQLHILWVEKVMR